MIITARERDLGGLIIRRILPYATHRMVGPFIFFDHIGPVDFAPGEGIDVRPHPHINLATVTYLFEGQLHHRDSLGSSQLIEPGAINWMTAGRGIVHSERSPAGFRRTGGRLNGLQCWVALPDEHEEIAPSFAHFPHASLPEFHDQDIRLRLLLGHSLGRQSPVPVHSDLFYLEAFLSANQGFVFPSEGREAAVYVVSGSIRMNGVDVVAGALGIAEQTEDLKIEATETSRLMFLGGHSIGPRWIDWNFVSSSQTRIEAAKADWAQGPRVSSARFAPIPADDQEFIPLPRTVGSATKGTPL
ncbi:MAG: pirin family protein [Bdellovibrionaceae bacterium]|nr:pirin family protein [Pseudobdellovibrionaceae bacterium]